MAKLPRDVSGERAVRAFAKVGYVRDHQTGSHIILVHTQDRSKRLTVPAHRAIRVGTLRGLIRDAGLTVEEFIQLL